MRIPSALMMNEGRALAAYGSGELGRLVPEGKYKTHPPRFSDKLVEACARMMEEWRPDPYPDWVTAIPSRNNPTLVDDFARRLAGRLGLPYVPCLKKVADTQAQKDMQNSAFQQNNLLNAFGIEGEVPGGHCLLADDMVDSRWTLTIAAALLRSAGVSSVTPLALADSSNGGE